MSENEYHNLDALSQGRTFGCIPEWPWLQKETHSALAEIRALRARVTELEADPGRRVPSTAVNELIRINKDLSSRVKELERNSMCDVCAGQGTALGDNPCICGGTGPSSGAVNKLRELLYEAIEAGAKDRDRLATSEAARVKAEGDKEKVHANIMQYAKAIEDAGLLLSCRPTGYKIINDPGTAYEILLLRARDAEQERDTAIRERDEALSTLAKWDLAANKRADAAEDALHQVDEILVVNWAGPRKDGDYRKALADLVSFNIKIYDDPQVSEVAAKRKQHLEDLERQNAELRSALGRARKEVVNVYDRLGHGNLESASALIGLAVVDIDKALASAPVEPQGEPAVKAQAFLDTFSRLDESNAEAARRFNEYEPTGTADDQIPRETVEAIKAYCMDCTRLQRPCMLHTPPPPACPNCAGLKEVLETAGKCLSSLYRSSAAFTTRDMKACAEANLWIVEQIVFQALASAKALLSGGGQEGK